MKFEKKSGLRIGAPGTRSNDRLPAPGTKPQTSKTRPSLIGGPAQTRTGLSLGVKNADAIPQQYQRKKNDSFVSATTGKSGRTEAAVKSARPHMRSPLETRASV